MNTSLRILGLTMERVADFRSRPDAKSSGLYAALDRRYEVAGIVRPAPAQVVHYYNKARHFHPDRDVWRARASLNPWMFKRRTAVAERQLQQWDGQYDVIMQLHTILAPGTRARQRRYVIHTDNTYMLSERYFPAWAPLRGRARAEWLQLERETYQGAAFLFPRSEFLRQSMIQDYGCHPDRVIRVGGGANFPVVPIEQKRYDSQIALFVGSDFERKGGMALLRAWETVRRALPDAQLWIVGPKRAYGEPQPGVCWHGFVSDRQAVAQMYRQAAAFVMPSLFEPWGHVFFEAMANGLPCIGSDRGATPEIVQHGRTGLLVPPGEPEPLAEALIALLGDPARAEALGRAAHADVAHGHTWDDVVSRMAPYLEQMCS
jgi:glycosyltransferase involved in cell wall biosynthesis